MHPQKGKHSKPLVSVTRAVSNFLGIHPSERRSEYVNPVDEVREGLRDIKAGRVREIKSVRDILKDE